METSDSTSSPTRQPPNEEEDDQERHDSSKEERNEQRSHFTDERLFGSSLFSEPIAYTRLRHGGDRFVDDFVLYALATTHISQNTRTFLPTSCPCPSSQVLLVSYSFNNSYLGSLLYGVFCTEPLGYARWGYSRAVSRVSERENAYSHTVAFCSTNTAQPCFRDRLGGGVFRTQGATLLFSPIHDIQDVEYSGFCRFTIKMESPHASIHSSPPISVHDSPGGIQSLSSVAPDLRCFRVGATQ